MSSQDSNDIVKEQKLELQIHSAQLATIDKVKYVDAVRARNLRKKSVKALAAGAILLVITICIKLAFTDWLYMMLSGFIMAGGAMLCCSGGSILAYNYFRSNYRETIVADRSTGIIRFDRKLGNRVLKPIGTWNLADIASLDCKNEEYSDFEDRTSTRFRFFARYKDGNTATLDFYYGAFKPETIVQHFNAWLEGKETEHAIYRDRI
nr:hypothetical protein [Candidatus Sigynarchaeota archaeon]